MRPGWETMTTDAREQVRAEFARDCNVCERCGALFHHDQGHTWSGTLEKGSALDLAGLVCNIVNDDRCINPCKGRSGGQTFETRMALVGLMSQEIKWEIGRRNEQQSRLLDRE